MLSKYFRLKDFDAEYKLKYGFAWIPVIDPIFITYLLIYLWAKLVNKI